MVTTYTFNQSGFPIPKRLSDKVCSQVLSDTQVESLVVKLSDVARNGTCAPERLQSVFYRGLTDDLLP